jgi:ABC-2 type transport system permease protein
VTIRFDLMGVLLARVGVTTRFLLIGLVLAVALALRLGIRSRRGRRSGASETGEGAGRGVEPEPVVAAPASAPRWRLHWAALEGSLGDVGLVALREIRERVRSRIFRVGTLIILVGVTAAIVIPAISKGTSGPQRVGVVGTVTPTVTRVIQSAGRDNGTGVQVLSEPTLAAAEDALRTGTLDVAVASDRVVVNQSTSRSNGTSTTTGLAHTLAAEVGLLHAYSTAGLSAGQIEQVAHAKPVPVQNLQGGATKPVKATSVVGLILLFVLLTQYNTWILMGVMQEKASRVVEVLLAAVRPIQLLGGKVLGIGLVAMGQAAAIVGLALVVSAAVGSDLLHGTAPLELVSQLLWLLLGYAFYCWVYAAAGSMAERQDQVQTLVLPLTLPILLGYVLGITAASTGTVSLFFEFLAYFPPTAPFAMPVLVGLGHVTWWGFVLSVLITLASTAVMAWVAAGIYRRAVLRSGQRVHLRDVWPGSRQSRGGSVGVVEPAG